MHFRERERALYSLYLHARRCGGAEEEGGGREAVVGVGRWQWWQEGPLRIHDAVEVQAAASDVECGRGATESSNALKATWEVDFYRSNDLKYTSMRVANHRKSFYLRINTFGVFSYKNMNE
jgi:hypothetical protein